MAKHFPFPWFHSLTGSTISADSFVGTVSDTGSVLFSPLIKPGTTSSTFYNHYSWLRTMEDIFGVSLGRDHDKVVAGTVSGGLDGQGHLGFAAQEGLAPFGEDVFNNVRGGWGH